MAELDLGLIGCGRLAERGYLPALARARGVRLAAVADTVQERGARLAPGVPALPALRSCLTPAGSMRWFSRLRSRRISRMQSSPPTPAFPS